MLIQKKFAILKKLVFYWFIIWRNKSVFSTLVFVKNKFNDLSQGFEVPNHFGIFKSFNSLPQNRSHTFTEPASRSYFIYNLAVLCLSWVNVREHGMFWISWELEVTQPTIVLCAHPSMARWSPRRSRCGSTSSYIPQVSLAVLRLLDFSFNLNLCAPGRISRNWGLIRVSIAIVWAFVVLEGKSIFDWWFCEDGYFFVYFLKKVNFLDGQRWKVI